MALEKLPPLHGSAAAAPGGQYEPPSHGLHAVSPSLSWYEPPAHGVHLSLTAVDASVYEPLAHGACSVEPVVAKWPGEASVHSLAAERLVAVE